MAVDGTDYDAIGYAVIDAIIEGSMIRVSGIRTGEDDPIVFLWNGNAAEQIGEAVRRLLEPPTTP